MFTLLLGDDALFSGPGNWIATVAGWGYLEAWAGAQRWPWVTPSPPALLNKTSVPHEVDSLQSASGHTGAGHFVHSAPQFPALSVQGLLKEARDLVR